MKERADKILVDRGLAESRHKAQALILAGLVYSEKGRVEKSGQLVPVSAAIFLKETMPYVSRGGLKLIEALRNFAVTPEGKVCADLGCSTGGFTDCLLQEGAKKVYAVDVDVKQIDVKLREDPRVVLIQKNARYLEPNDIPVSLDVVTVDLSFISVLKILPAIKNILGMGELIALIKPPFEAGRGQVGKGGVIRSPNLHAEILERILHEADRMEFKVQGLIKASLRGQKGNREFFVHWSLSKEAWNATLIQKYIKEAVWDG
ncbi:MAG: TlyA family RNA methyltransferase [Candidatus Aminicenantes bacterium]|jgi:23S rRNA (cytidine1920-2'-O)/16S rRNA (cytidine1409-2'-O)-methyltransferase